MPERLWGPDICISPKETYDRTISIRISNNTYDYLCGLAKLNNTNIAVICRAILDRDNPMK